jgi:hypothetical protein
VDEGNLSGSIREALRPYEEKLEEKLTFRRDL